MSFITVRDKILKSLDKAIEEGKVDKEVLGILHLINKDKGYVTTSSCAGRIQIIELESLGEKKSSHWVGKFHTWPGYDDILESIVSWKGDGKGYLFLQCQSPIFHIRCSGIKEAKRLLVIGRESGFKYSSIRSIRLDKGGRVVEYSIVVELLTPNRLDLPLGRDGDLYLSRGEIKNILIIFRNCLLRGKSALNRLENNLRKMMR